MPEAQIRGGAEYSLGWGPARGGFRTYDPRGPKRLKRGATGVGPPPRSAMGVRDEPGKQPPQGGREDLEGGRTSEAVRPAHKSVSRNTGDGGPPRGVHVCKGCRIYFLGGEGSRITASGVRDAHPPCDRPKTYQKWMDRNLLNRVSQISFPRGRSLVTSFMSSYAI